MSAITLRYFSGKLSCTAARRRSTGSRSYWLSDFSCNRALWSPMLNTSATKVVSNSQRFLRAQRQLWMSTLSCRYRTSISNRSTSLLTCFGTKTTLAKKMMAFSLRAESTDLSSSRKFSEFYYSSSRTGGRRGRRTRLRICLCFRALIVNNDC